MSVKSESLCSQDAALKRDVRIDRLGFGNELFDQYLSPLNNAVKADMKPGERREADYFSGLMTEAISAEMDAEAFVKKWEDGKMTRAQFISAIKPNLKRAREILGEKDMLAITTFTPGARSLKVSRRKGVQIELITALRALSGVIDPIGFPKVA